MTPAEKLAEFHAALGDEPGRGNAALRMTLHDEEQRELMLELRAARAEELEGLQADTELRERIARELADVVYIAYGTAHSFDIDLEAALTEVHRAAMSKLYPPCEHCAGTGDYEALLPREEQAGAHDPCRVCGGTGRGERVVREDGKVMKPLGFVAPDMTVAVRGVQASR